MDNRFLSAGALAASVTLVACGGGGGSGSSESPVPPPQLSPAIGAALQGTCEDFAARSLPDTVITNAERVETGELEVGGQPIAAHCLVTGRMFERIGPIDGEDYAIAFEMRLPLAWNGRFFHQGNGGLDGSVVTATGGPGGGGALTNALHQGFAVLSSDAGHRGALGPNFGIDPQARLDYGYQAVAKLTPMAREMISAAYGKEPDRSYFGGCSNGGRHAMIAATRYASDYDGILVGAPGYNLPKAAVANIAAGQQFARAATEPGNLGSAFTADERRLVANAILERCDALDGVVDGLVQDTAACQAAFDLDRDVPTCTGVRDGSCLTETQKEVVASVSGGARTSDGALVYASFPYDPGVQSSNYAFWRFTAPLVLDSGAVGLVFQVPPEDPATFNGPAFALGADIDELVRKINATDLTYTESAMSFMPPPNPTDMSGLRDRGGRIIAYHGTSDAIFSVQDTINWFEGLQAANDGDASSFARFYNVPGMAHCSGGPATDQFDLLSPLVAWVEHGTAPNAVIARARGVGNPGGVNSEVPSDWAADRTRPLCPYPLVAHYSGEGDSERAENFVCR